MRAARFRHASLEGRGGDLTATGAEPQQPQSSQTDDFSPRQIGVVSTRMSEAIPA
jgi:hypothetical protein